MTFPMALIKKFLGMHRVREPKKKKLFGKKIILTPNLTYLGTQEGVIRDMAKEITHKGV